MPTVPIYKSRVQSAAMPTPRVSPAPSGSAELGAGVQRLGTAALQYATEERDRADKVRVDSADLDLGKVLNGASWGDDGFLHQKGEHALDFSKRFEELQRQAATISSGLANDRQRELFQARALARVEQTREAWEKHSASQWGVIQGQIAEGQTQFAIDEASANHRDLDAVQSALQKVITDPDGGPGVLVRYLQGRDKGLPKEAIDRAVQQFLREGYKVTLQRYLDAEDADGAKAFLDRFGSAMGPEAGKAQKALAVIGRKREAFTAGRSIIEAARGGEFGFVDPARALALARENADANPTKAKEVFEVVEGELRRATAEKKATVDALYDKVLADYERRRSLADVNATELDRLRRMDADSRQKFERIRLADVDRWKREQEKKPGETQEERDAYIELQADMVARPDVYSDMTPEEFKREWAHRLSPKAYKAGGTMLAGAQKRSLVDQREFSLAVDAEMTRNGISQKADQTQFRAYLKTRMDQHQASSSKAPTRDELQSWLDDATNDVLVKGRLFGTNRRVRYKVAPGETIVENNQPPAASPPPAPTEVPDDVRARIVRDYQVKFGDGTQPTGATIIKAYEAGKRRGLW